jgi:predicted DnaQ family exonuclease/DinG family helicase
VTLFAAMESTSLQSVFVALDLETTGLDSDQDQIIEVGAVKFRGSEVLDTFSSLVNTKRTLTPFIQRLTGINPQEVKEAPPFSTVAPLFTNFVGESPVVGHNVWFDINFLSKAGVRFTSPVFDTRELAAMLLPNGNYTLGILAKALGVPEWGAHRALGDAQATHLVLDSLIHRALDMDPGVIAELDRLATVANWPLRHLLRAITKEQDAQGKQSAMAMGGVDLTTVERRIHPVRSKSSARPREASSEAAASPEEVASALVGAGGALERVIPGFEHRAEQERMLVAVAQAFANEEHLVVEAGTGVGKSMAYLLPAADFALRNKTRVVVSTNTISLQEQLIRKDLPSVTDTLAEADVANAADLRFTSLKGRANYLCLRRWSHLRSSADLSVDEARFMGKLTCWLQETDSGDRADLRMSRQDNGVWEKLSAQGSRECPLSEGACFLRSSRERADAADVVVVNHSLLLSDLARGGGLIPDYDYLIVDEAQHLESEATNQLGSKVAYAQFTEHLDALSGPRGLATEAVNAYRTSKAGESRRQATEQASTHLTEAVTRARQRLDEMFAALNRFIRNRDGGNGGQQNQMRVTSAVRTQPDWSELEVVWENPSAALADVVRAISGLRSSLDGLEKLDLLNYDGLRSDLSAQEEALEENRGQADGFMLRPDASNIYWVEGNQQSNHILCTAPLHVGEILKQKLFDTKKSVVLTSATLAVAGSFAPLRERLGVEEIEELLLGSPFNYPRAALICIPQDMPEPNSTGYAATIAKTVAELARAADGHTLALFTSHAALRAAAEVARAALEADDIRVLAQGVDGAPRALMDDFLSNPRSLLLGTSSFWEGVDLAGDALTVLVLARLPFDVPTDPVFAARSEGYEDPFRDYAVPQAVLRFRQGFGRLIRTGTDRGVVAVLDRRLTARSYGSLFLKSLPDCAVERPQLNELPGLVTGWLAAPPTD